jgi:hypothetical protein
MYKTISKQIIKEFEPAFSSPSKYIKDDNEELPVIEWIKKYRDVVPARDIVLLLLRKEFISEKNLRLFSIWCAREALKLIEDPDHRCIEACDVAERYANGEATKEELNTAHASAYAVYRAANHYTDSDSHELDAYYATVHAIYAAVNASDNAHDINDIAYYAAENNAFAVYYAASYASYVGDYIFYDDDVANAVSATQLEQLLTYF